MHKDGSARDQGTYAANAVVSGYTNALGDVLDGSNYEKIKEFMTLENEAMIVSAFLLHWGFSIDSEDIVPEDILKGNVTMKRTWFNKMVRDVIKKYITQDLSHIKDLVGNMRERTNNTFPCRAAGCDKKFFYEKVRIKHENREHQFVEEEFNVESDKECNNDDDLLNYSKKHLALCS